MGASIMADLGQIPKWMKKATPFIYARISSQEQVADEASKPLIEQTPIRDQIRGMQKALKEKYGLPQAKKANIFVDLASGGDMNREGFNAMKEAVLNHKGRSFFVISEPSRWSRNTTLGEEAYAPFYRRNIPQLITSNGLITQTQSEPSSLAQAMISLQAIFAQSERANLIERVNRKKRILIDQAILPAGIGSFFPFARQDPLEVLLDNVSLLDVPVKEGGGGAALGRLVVSSTAPNGPTSEQWYRKELERHTARIAQLDAEELEEWFAFRDYWRELQQERNYDSQKDGNPSGDKDDKNKVDWGMKAAQRFANGYLRYPFKAEYRDSKPTKEQIQEYLTNPKEFLSDNDKRLYKRLVSKR